MIGTQTLFTRLEAPLLALLFASLVLGDGLALGLYYALLGALILSRTKISPPWRWLLLSYAAFILWAALSIALAGHGIPRSGEATLPLAWAAVIVCALALRRQTDERTQRAMRFLAVATVIVSLFAVAQYLFDMSIVGVWLRRPPERLSVPVPGAADHSVASGFFFNRLKLAFTLGATLPLLVFLWRAKIVVKFVVCALAGLALALTYSRSALVAMLCSLTAGALTVAAVKKHVSRRQLAIAASGLGLATLLSLFVPALSARVWSIFSAGSYADRAFIWARALEMRSDNPIFGIGFGNYPRVCQSYYDAVDPSFVMRTHAHAQGLSILVESGPLGLVLFLSWLAAIARLVWLQRHIDTERFAAGVAVFANLLIVMLVHDPLQHSASGLAFACALGVTVAVPAERSSAHDGEAPLAQTLRR